MKVRELVGIALDWAVAVCEGYSDLRSNPNRFDPQLIMTPPRVSYGPVHLYDLNYSTDWSIGGPIIEKYGIEIRVHCIHNNRITSWASEHNWPMDPSIGACGPTPLIAAMRYLVISKLGHEVDIPEELL